MKIAIVCNDTHGGIQPYVALGKGLAVAGHDVLGIAPPAPLREAKGTVFYGFSKYVVPLPVEGLRPRHVVGYWSLPTPDNCRPPDGLEAFIALGPVVSIGFGSMSSSDASAMTAIAVRAVRRAGLRAVLLSGWGGLASFNAPDIYCTDAVPHD